MKCPKCGYIGFETSNRCRNCGYDFTLTPAAPEVPDLPLGSRTPLGPMADLTIGGQGQTPESQRPQDAGRPDFDFDRYAPPPAVSDLPLFEDSPPPSFNAPIGPAVPPPRPPLAVRRSTPPPARLRSRMPRSEQVDLDLKIDVPSAAAVSRTAVPVTAVSEAATVRSRVFAVLIDALVIAPIDLVVIYFTLRLCRLTLQEATLLPVVPLLVFFLILDGGYLLAFTAAGGQTMGKMGMGLKVVAADGARVGPGRALARTLAWIVSAVPLGAGLLPAVFDSERRALHDRVAGTRVVTASSR
jgi:uncharacterized RDD family membrane protein YckC